MNSTLWPTDKYLRAIHLFGLLIWLGLIAISLQGFVGGVGDVLSEGLSAFFLYMVMMFVGCIIFSVLAILPYAVGSIAARMTGARFAVAALCFVVFAVNVWVLIDLVFFPSSSTHALILIFAPIYLSILVAAVWFVIFVINALRRRLKGI